MLETQTVPRESKANNGKVTKKKQECEVRKGQKLWRLSLNEHTWKEVSFDIKTDWLEFVRMYATKHWRPNDVL